MEPQDPTSPPPHASTRTESELDGRSIAGFEHGETGERVYYDPRFAKDTDVPNVRRWKLECLNALRPAVYLGAGLVEAWDTAAEGARGKKARQETLKRVLKNAKTFVRDLSSEVLRAKELWVRTRRPWTFCIGRTWRWGRIVKQASRRRRRRRTH